MNARRSQSRSAFTLVELMMAVLLLALLTSAAALSFSGALDRSRAQDAVSELQSFDATSRDAARHAGQEARMAFDLSAGTIARREGADLQTLKFQMSLPHGIQIDQLRVAGQSYFDGEVVVDISALGLSRSYAVHITGAGLDRWLLFAGQSGDMTQVQDEGTMQDILDRAAPVAFRPWEQTARHDAD
jgi:prepilin-type N-terminal cleavage/methylation domain-containing protein